MELTKSNHAIEHLERNQVFMVRKMETLEKEVKRLKFILISAVILLRIVFPDGLDAIIAFIEKGLLR